MLIFDEATTHGTMPWVANHERRSLLYRYSPTLFALCGRLSPDHLSGMGERTDRRAARSCWSRLTTIDGRLSRTTEPFPYRRRRESDNDENAPGRTSRASSHQVRLIIPAGRRRRRGRPLCAGHGTGRSSGAVWRGGLVMLQVASKVVPRQVVLPFQSALTLLSGAIFWLFLLAILNVALRRWRPRAVLRPAEFADHLRHLPPSPPPSRRRTR